MKVKTALTKALEMVKDRLTPQELDEFDLLFDYEMRIQFSEFGQFVKDERRRLNLTQEELGVLVGVKKAQISKIESGAGALNLKTVNAIAKSLGIKIEFIVTKISF